MPMRRYIPEQEFGDSAGRPPGAWPGGNRMPGPIGPISVRNGTGRAAKRTDAAGQA